MNLFQISKKGWGWLMSKIYHSQYENIHKTARIYFDAKVYNPDNLIMEEETNIDGEAVIMNTKARFIMKKWSGAAFGLTVVTGEHLAKVGMHLKQVTDKVKEEFDVNHKLDQDVIVYEDCWIGSRCTLLKGAIVGRGSVIGSGSVIRGTVPPYSIMVGNPAKIVGFRFTPEEIVEHERPLYPEKERIPIELLEKNYQKFFLNRIKEIKDFQKI